MSLSVQVYNKGKYIFILDEGLTQGLDDTILAAAAKYPVNSTQSGKRFVLTLHYNRNISFLFVNATKVYQFNYILCLSNISKDATINDMKKETGLKGVVKRLSVDFNPINTNDILDIHRYLMKRT